MNKVRDAQIGKINLIVSMSDGSQQSIFNPFMINRQFLIYQICFLHVESQELNQQKPEIKMRAIQLKLP